MCTSCMKESDKATLSEMETQWLRLIENSPAGKYDEILTRVVEGCEDCSSLKLGYAASSKKPGVNRQNSRRKYSRTRKRYLSETATTKCGKYKEELTGRTSWTDLEPLASSTIVIPYTCKTSKTAQRPPSSPLTPSSLKTKPLASSTIITPYTYKTSKTAQRQSPSSSPLTPWSLKTKPLASSTVLESSPYWESTIKTRPLASSTVLECSLSCDSGRGSSLNTPDQKPSNNSSHSNKKASLFKRLFRNKYKTMVNSLGRTSTKISLSSSDFTTESYKKDKVESRTVNRERIDDTYQHSDPHLKFNKKAIREKMESFSQIYCSDSFDDIQAIACL